jgi:hypothetical protein
MRKEQNKSLGALETAAQMFERAEVEDAVDDC